MQPTYLPWSGYFNLINSSDIFVFLDDAQYQKNSWHNRNRILLGQATHWITTPVRKEVHTQSIQNTIVDDAQNWREKQVRLISQNYARHPFVSDLVELYAIIRDDKLTSLADLNIAVILWASAKLEITTEMHRSSELGIEGQRTDRIISILKFFNADEYLSPVGAGEYLAQDAFTEHSSCKLTFQNFNPPQYTQLKSDTFVSHLSFIDVLANIGWKGLKEYI